MRFCDMFEDMGEIDDLAEARSYYMGRDCKVLPGGS
jgi:hypothetical protein